MSRHAHKQAESSTMPPAAKPRTASKDAGPASASGLGNAATARLLEEGKAIPAEIRARMEQSFGVDLKGVRIDDRSAAREETDAQGAEAMVRDGQIHWGASAPPVESPEAVPLLAHEVAHVIQQQRASSIDNRVSSPGESSEVAAHSAAGQVMAGRSASVSGGGAVAGTQRQPKGPLAPKTFSDPQTATQLLTAYLQKVAKTTPPQNIRKAKVVRDALRKLAFSAGPVAGMLDVDAFVDANNTSGDPATMARQFVAKVPRISAAALQGLATAPFIDQQAGFVQRATDLVTGSAAGGGDVPLPEGHISAEDRAKNTGDTLAAMRGGTVPGGVGPVKVDVLQVGRIIQGLGGVVKPKATKPAGPQSEDYPAVTAAIAKMPKDALIPAEAKDKSDAAGWATTAEFAAELARAMDIAQKSKQTETTVTLGENYAQVKNREALRDAVEAIIQQLRDALPHHAAGVKYVIVKTGKTTLTRGIVQTP
jgi:hypothetical protein